MAEQSNELKKLFAVATDLVLSGKLRTKSIELIGSLGTHDALLALLELAANEQLTKGCQVSVNINLTNLGIDQPTRLLLLLPMMINCLSGSRLTYLRTRQRSLS